MTEQARRNQLGRGLSALFGEDGADYTSLDRVRASKDVPIGQLHPNPKQPRRRFDDEATQELAASMKTAGVLQPILVRRHPERASDYEIVAGERRWRAAQLAQLHQVPVVIRDLDDQQTLELALVENLQRQDLNPLDEAVALQRLIDEHDHRPDDLAKALGKSRSYVANSLRLLGLPDTVKSEVEAGRLSAGHARALINAEDPAALAGEVIAKGLSVREAEALARAAKGERAQRRGKAEPKAPVKDADTLALERDLSDLLGLRVSIDIHGQGGSLTIHYKTLEQLDDVLQRLNQTPSPI
ncbi:MAG: ParB/RepB/Spo0J family partition protein [Kiloniellales bacterium]|nr:ParB/RepB/Spo0J family partition protein [Kiloniellales bacterium]